MIGFFYIYSPLLYIMTQNSTEVQQLEQQFHTVTESVYLPNKKILGDISASKMDSLSKNFEKNQPKNLAPLSESVIQKTIQANAHTKNFLQWRADIVSKAHEGINFLVSQWLNIYQAMGIIANGIAENWLSTDQKKSGLGIFQWIGKRANEYKRLRSTLPGNDEFQKQLSYMLYELKNTEKKAYNALSSIKTPEEAARVILRDFERPKVLNYTVRSAIANWLRNLLW